MHSITWSCKEKYSIWYAVTMRSHSPRSSSRQRDRESLTRQLGSCPRRTNMPRTTERPHSQSIRVDGAFSNARSSVISSLWPELRVSPLRHGTCSAAEKSGQTQRRPAVARPEKKVARSSARIGSAQRRRGRCVSYSSKLRRRSGQKVSLQVSYLSKDEWGASQAE